MLSSKLVLMAFFFICSLLSITSGLHAQKIGHVNLNNILEQLEIIEDANTKLAVFQDSLNLLVEQKQKDLNQRIEQAGKKFELGELSEQDAQKIQVQFARENEMLYEWAVLYDQKVQAKRSQMLDPILDMVESKIATFAKNNGYNFIFNESMGAIMFDREEDDISSQILELIESDTPKE